MSNLIVTEVATEADIIRGDDTPENGVTKSPADVYASPQLKIMLATYITNGYDVYEAMDSAKYAHTNRRKVKMKFFKHPVVKHTLAHLFENDKGYAKSFIVRELRDIMSAHRDKASRNVMSAKIVLDYVGMIGKLLNLFDPDTGTTATLEDLLHPEKVDKVAVPPTSLHASQSTSA